MPPVPLHQEQPGYELGPPTGAVSKMDYAQQYGYQPVGYNSYHYQYSTPANHLKVGPK